MFVSLIPASVCMSGITNLAQSRELHSFVRVDAPASFDEDTRSASAPGLGVWEHTLTASAADSSMSISSTCAQNTTVSTAAIGGTGTTSYTMSNTSSMSSFSGTAFARLRVTFSVDAPTLVDLLVSWKHDPGMDRPYGAAQFSLSNSDSSVQFFSGLPNGWAPIDTEITLPVGSYTFFVESAESFSGIRVTSPTTTSTEWTAQLTVVPAPGAAWTLTALGLYGAMRRTRSAISHR